MIQKPTKLAESYRPISLLPVLLKLSKKLLLRRISIIMESYGLIPDYQFGFQNKYTTIQQIHRIVKKINNNIKGDRYCIAILDIS